MGDIADQIHDEQLHQRTNRRGNAKRSKKRSRSGAKAECPKCGKHLRGDKGLKKHLADVHGVDA